MAGGGDGSKNPGGSARDRRAHFSRASAGFLSPGTGKPPRALVRNARQTESQVSQTERSMRGPAPTPNVVKLLRGNPGKRAIRPEPQPEIPPTVPEPPEFIVGFAREEWVRLAGELWRLRLLTVADLMVFSGYCQAFARWKSAELALAKIAERDPVTDGLLVKGASGDPTINPLLRVSSQAAQNMVHFAGHFGLSPAARARIAAGPYGDGGGPSKFDGLLA